MVGVYIESTDPDLVWCKSMGINQQQTWKDMCISHSFMGRCHKLNFQPCCCGFHILEYIVSWKWSTRWVAHLWTYKNSYLRHVELMQSPLNATEDHTHLEKRLGGTNKFKVVPNIVDTILHNLDMSPPWIYHGWNDIWSTRQKEMMFFVIQSCYIPYPTQDT